MNEVRPDIDSTLYEYLSRYIECQGLCDFVHPNTVTLFAMALLYPFNIYLSKLQPIPVLIILSIRVVLDFLDGQLARKCDKKTKLGSVLDSLNDAAGLSLLAFNILILVMPGANTWISLLIIFAIVSLIVHNSIDVKEDHTTKTWFGSLTTNNAIFFNIITYTIWILVVFYWTKRC
jgi:phosphatidylglycerophosphate synthase